MTAILTVKNFSKNFRSHWTFRSAPAVKDISFAVNEGECFGFLGHNGAGKTTTIKSLLGLISKTKGEFLFYDQPLNSAAQRSVFGYLPEQPYFYEHLTVEETLLFFGALHNIPKPELKQRCSQVLELLGIADRAKNPIRTLSKGLQQRLGIAQAIINRPRLLFLDEPFSGLDPVGRKEIRQLITNLNKEGTTIFLSSHILSDVENMCQRAAILARGELKTIVQLKGQNADWTNGKFALTIVQHEQLAAFIQAHPEICTPLQRDDLVYSSALTMVFTDYKQSVAALQDAISRGLTIQAFAEERPSLEDVFVSIVEGIK
ncbi:MAG: ABC transporter ATP-binding protein [Deltaproteobacteria bacterium]|nr:ABC transporter ATP-binding protein [Deltaproteobacteria bacterium]